MCITCGCSGSGNITDHHHHDENNRLIELEQDVLLQNNLLAERNKGYFMAKKILCVNLVSSPGSGKTTLLERTLTDLKGKLDFTVIEGDQHTSADADRISRTGFLAKQINTGKGCHLDAHMVHHALEDLNPSENSILFIENVGNLVCPSMFNLGEQERVVVISTTEGDDKPLKYPDIFHTSSICIINKIDLLPYVNTDIEVLKNNMLKINPYINIFEVSCTTGEGLEDWYKFLINRR